MPAGISSTLLKAKDVWYSVKLRAGYSNREKLYFYVLVFILEWLLKAVERVTMLTMTST